MPKHNKTDESMQNVQLGDKRSVALDVNDKNNLKAVIKYAGTIVAAAGIMGVDRNKLPMWIGPGKRTVHPVTLKKLREFFDRNPEMIGQGTPA